MQDVNKLWEKAVQELDRDEQLVKFIEEKEQKQEVSIFTLYLLNYVSMFH